MADSEQRLRVTFSRDAVEPEMLLEAAEARMADAGPVVSEAEGEVTLTVAGPQASPLSALYRASTASAIMGLMQVLGIEPAAVLRLECVQAEWEDHVASFAAID